MTDAMEVLFSHAQDYLEKPLLLSLPGYSDALYHVNQQQARLIAMLSNEANQLLDDYLSQRNLLFTFEAEAMFRAGFQLAMELGRF